MPNTIIENIIIIGLLIIQKCDRIIYYTYSWLLLFFFFWVIFNWSFLYSYDISSTDVLDECIFIKK